MASLTVRISPAAHANLRQLADEGGETMQAILEKAVESYRRQRFMEEFNAAYAALRADSQAWSEIEKERAIWDGTLMDGLDPNETWTDDGDVVFHKPKGRKRRA
jgi:predicted transcriptional regulator